MTPHNKFRRRFISLLGGLAGAGLTVKTAQASHTNTHFGDEVAHHIVYQCDKADNAYYAHILFSVGELIRKYGDNVEVVVAAFGPGLQLLGEHPTEHVDKINQERVQSLDQYGVSFHACGNTMKSLGWKKIDLLEVAKIVPIGVDNIMLLQEKGFSYIAI